MNYKKIFKRETKVIAYVVICLTLVVLGTSYALFLQVNNNTNNQVVKAGTLQITFSEGTTTGVTEDDDSCLSPKSDSEGSTEGCNFKFSLTNTGTLPMQYNLLIYDNKTDGQQPIDKSLIKFALNKKNSEEGAYSKVVENAKNLSELSNYTATEGDVQTSSGQANSNVEKKILNTDIIKPGEYIEFSLYIWIDEDTATEDLIGKPVDLQLDVSGVVFENAQTLASISDLEGKYVKYMPFQTEFAIGQEDTGSDGVQTINPSELNSWQILNKNDDNSIDIISESVSSIEVKFKGKVGYQHLVGALKKLAEAYEDKAYTTKSRMPGYNDQTAIISTDLDSANCSGTTGVQGWQESQESSGCGDMGYQTDEGRMNTVFSNNLTASSKGTAKKYWYSSRWYGGSSSQFSGRYINESGQHQQGALYENSQDKEFSAGLRPIVTLKPGVTIASGTGSKEDPYVLSEFIEESD